MQNQKIGFSATPSQIKQALKKEANRPNWREEAVTQWIGRNSGSVNRYLDKFEKGTNFNLIDKTANNLSNGPAERFFRRWGEIPALNILLDKVKIRTIDKSGKGKWVFERRGSTNPNHTNNIMLNHILKKNKVPNPNIIEA